MTVKLAATKGIQPNDIIVIQNNTVAETQWNYKKSCTSLVVEICSNTVTLAHPLNFDFGVEEPGNSVTVYRANHRVSFEHITLHALSLGPTEARLINFEGLKNVMLRDIVQENNGLNTFTINFHSCVDCHAENSTIFTGTYPYLVNLSRNLTFNNLQAYDAHHVVSPATWTDTVYINNLFARGCDGGVESHPAFNIHYRNVDVCDKNSYSGLRCVGGSIRSGVIRHVGDSSSGPYFHNVELVDKSIYDDYDFVVEGLLYDQDGKSFNPAFGRRFIFRDSEFRGGLHLGRHGNIKEVHLENCIYDSFLAKSLSE